MSIYAMKKPKRINAVSVSITLIFLLIGYLLWFAIPVYWPNFQMGGIMKSACNDAYRMTDDEEVMKKLVKSSQRTGLRLTKDNFRFTRVEYTPEERAERKLAADSYQAKRGKTCIIEFYFEKDYKWPLIDATTHIVFEKQVEGDLTQVEW